MPHAALLNDYLLTVIALIKIAGGGGHLFIKVNIILVIKKKIL